MAASVFLQFAAERRDKNRMKTDLEQVKAKARMLLEKSCAAMDESMKEIAEAE